MHKTREKSRVQSAIGFGFASNWVKNWRETFKPITKRSNRNRVITFDSHLKTALKYICIAIKNDLMALLGTFSNTETLTSDTKKTQLTRDHGIMQMILLANQNCCHFEMHRIVSCLILLLFRV